jgi:hypothetical protein
MKKLTGVICSAAMTLFMATSTTANAANTEVTAIDDSTLKVVIFDGRPPHKRFTVSKADEPARFDHYAQLLDTDVKTSIDSTRAWKKAPGKY